jgi:mRNA-degrading endonuclease RelE of RelBE toxin-antitoxin system
MLLKKIALRICLFFCLGCFCSSVFADTVVLKSGQIVEGKIIENTGKYVKIDFDGVELTYFPEEIVSINQGRANNVASKELFPIYETFNSGNKVSGNKNPPVASVKSAQPIVNPEAQDVANVNSLPLLDIAGGANSSATVQAALSQLPKEYQDMIKSRLQNMQGSGNADQVSSGVPPIDLSDLSPEYQEMIKSSLNKLQPNPQERKN